MCPPRRPGRPAQMTVLTDRHPHSGPHTHLPKCLPGSDTDVRAHSPPPPPQQSARSHVPPEHTHRRPSPGLCTSGFAAGVAGETRKVHSCSADTGSSQLPARIPQRARRFPTSARGCGRRPWLSAASAGFSSSQRVPAQPAARHQHGGPGEGRSQSPRGEDLARPPSGPRLCQASPGVGYEVGESPGGQDGGALMGRRLGSVLGSWW